MNRKLKKVIALGIAFIMAAGTFAGCSKKDPVEGSNSDKTATSANSGDKYAPKDGKVYEISTLHMGYASVDSNSEILQNYNKTFNVKINPVFIDPNKWDELLNLKFASEEIPDIIIAKGVDMFAKYQSQGLLTEVPVDVVKKYSPDLYNTINEEAPKAWNVTNIKGKNYGIPYIIGGNKFTDAILWRDDWLKNVGINKTPETIQEFEDAFVKFVNNDPDKNGKKDTYGLSSDGMETIFGAFGNIIFPFGNARTAWGKVLWKEKDGKLVYGAIDQGAKDALALLAKWYKMGIINPEFITGENKGGSWGLSHDFVNGRIGYTNRGYWYHWRIGADVPGNADGSSTKEFKKINPNGSFVWGKPPVGPDGKTRGVGREPIANGTVYAFSKNLTNEPDKLGKILQMFNWPAEKPENWLYNWGGVEGKHYTMQEVKDTDGKVYKIPTKTAEFSDAAKSSAAGLIQFFYEADAKNSKLTMPTWYGYQEKVGADKFGVETALIAPLPSAGKYLADLDKMREEAYYKIITGDKPIEYFDEFVANWKKAGGEQLLKEAEEYYKNLK